MRSGSVPRLSLAILMMAAAASAPRARADDALYRDLGRRATLERIVADAVARWVADARIADTFDNLNLDRFKRRLTDQLCELAGGPCHYTGRNMYLTHKGLHLDIVQFNALVEDLQDAMDQERVPFRTQNRLLAILAPMKRDIVTR
jgi:hemoglobin